jgi:predicted amidohydrolase YtcJ
MSDAVLFTEGRIWTGRRYVSDLLVEGGLVVAAGRADEVRRSRPGGTEDRRLAGRVVLPGLVDAHLHLAELTRVREGLDLHGVESMDRLLERVARWAETHPTGPLVGRGWDQERMGGAMPTRHDLERIGTGRPVVLYHASGHMAVLSRAALEAAGYVPGSSVPPGGRLGRGPDGEWDGRVYERALAPVNALIHDADVPGPEALARTLQSLGRLGLTSVCTLSTDPVEWRALRGLTERIRLPIRVRAYVLATLLDRFSPRDLGHPDPAERLGVAGTKSFLDGAFGPRTAWLSAPYADRAGEVGESTLAGADLDRALERTVELGLVPALHAIGDRAVAEAVRALGACRRAKGATARIEHLGLVPPPLLGPLADVRPTLVVQPGFVWSDGWLHERLGAERVRWAYPFRTLQERGLTLVGSSDAPYDPPDPWRGLAAAVHRTGPDGRSANPDPGEALSPEAAVDLYTGSAGRGLGEPRWGSLEPGAPADLVVVHAPDLARALAVGSDGVDETWAEGIPVYARGGRPGE